MILNKPRWAGRAAGAGVLGLALVGGLAVPAYAEAIPWNMFPNRNTPWDCKSGRSNPVFCRTDNATLTVYIEGSISATGKKRIKEVLKREFDATDLKVKFEAHPVYTGGNETDVIYKKGSIPGGAYGMTWCNDAINTYKCDQHYVEFKSASPSESTICHETGHSVGLTHGQHAAPRTGNNDSRLGCMRTPGRVVNLGTNNKKWINKVY